SFAIPVVLDVWQRTAWRAEVREDPRRRPTQKRNLLQHRDLMLVDALLILLGPSRRRITMMTEQSIAAKFTHHERLLILRAPLQSIRFLRQTIVPTDILVTPKHV